MGHGVRVHRQHAAGHTCMTHAYVDVDPAITATPARASTRAHAVGAVNASALILRPGEVASRPTANRTEGFPDMVRARGPRWCARQA